MADPISGQPESKHAAVQLAPYPAIWHGFMLSRRKLAIDSTDFYWSAHRLSDAWQYTLASDDHELNWEGFARGLLCEDNENVNWVEYLDSAQQTYRAARFIGNTLESCIFIGMADKALPAAEWLATLFSKPELEVGERRSLLTGKPVMAVEDTGRTVCACFNVGEKTIRKAMAEQGLRTVEAIGQCLQAGTNCGSCVPELRELLG